MKRGFRKERMGEEIRKIISDMLLRDIKDPRLSSMVSITEVDVSRDGSYAKVYLTSFAVTDNKEEANAEVLEGMNHAKGTFKREIGQRLQIRHVPELVFKIDESLEYGRHMDELIDKVMKKDEN